MATRTTHPFLDLEDRLGARNKFYWKREEEGRKSDIGSNSGVMQNRKSQWLAPASLRFRKKRKKITASGRQDLTSVFFVFPKVVRKAAYTKLRHAHHAFAKKYREERKIQILTWQGEKHVFSIKTFLIIFPPLFSKLLS